MSTSRPPPAKDKTSTSSRPTKDKTSAPARASQYTRIPTKPSSNDANKRSLGSDMVASAKSGRPAPQHVPIPGKTTGRSTAQRATASSTARAAPTLPSATNPALAAPRKLSATSSHSARAEGALSPSSRHDSTMSPPIHTPSLLSATSISTIESSLSKSLKRKPSTIEQYKRGLSSKGDEKHPTISRKRDSTDEEFDDSILGIALPPTQYSHSATLVPADLSSHIFDDGHAPPRDITLPSYAQSATPSTRYTDSPFSHVPTPSSASSCSPAALATDAPKAPRQRQPSPTRSRPPLSGRTSDKVHVSRLGLSVVRESSTSSSNSTVKPSESRSTPSKKSAPHKPASAPPAQTKLVASQLAAVAGTAKEQLSNTKPTVQNPPELAHLNFDPSSKSSASKLNPPRRPSREGTPVLTGVTIPSPVVQSDLPRLYTTYHKRTPSQETQSTPASPSLKARFGFSSKTSSRQASPRVDSAISPPPNAKTFSREQSRDGTVADAQQMTRKDSPAIGSSTTKSTRFGLFSRKPKTDSTKPPEKPTRRPSKGPTAGTGHEGYGRFSMQRRSSSTSSSAGYRSPSTESNTSSQYTRHSSSRKSSAASKGDFERKLEPFLQDKLSPVILRGGTTSNQTSSLDSQMPSGPNSSHNSSLDDLPPPRLLPSALDSAAGRSPAKKSVRSRKAFSDSSEDDVAMRYPTSMKQPSAAPIDTGRRYDHAGLGRNDAHRPSQDSSLDGFDGPDATRDLPQGKEGIWLRSGKAEVERKPHRKWNFFQRAQASPRDKGKKPAVLHGGMTRDLVQDPSGCNVAHYATMGPVESVGLEEIERIALENETSPEDSNSDGYAQSRSWPHKQLSKGLSTPPLPSGQLGHLKPDTSPAPPRILIRQQSDDSSALMYADSTVPHQAPHVVDIRRSPTSASMQLSEPEQKAKADELRPVLPQSRDEIRTPEVPQGSSHVSGGLENPSPPRQPRLSPIGRIPKVVSKRDRERKLSDSSFSRPFIQGQPKPTVKPPGSLYSQIRELASPIESNSQPVSSTSTNSNRLSGDARFVADGTVRRDSTNRASTYAFEKGEFLSTLPRSNSDVSYSSSSGNNSVFATLAAQPPQLEDEWHEYNDLCDEVIYGKLERSAGPPFAVPYQHSNAFYDSPQLSSQPWHPPSVGLPALPRSHGVPMTSSVPQHFASASSLMAYQVPADGFGYYRNRSSSTSTTGKPASGRDVSRTSILQQPRTNTTAPSRLVRTSIPEPNRSILAKSSRSSLTAQNRSSLPHSSRSSLPSARGSVSSSARNSRNSAHSRSASLPEANARNSQSSLTPSVRFQRDTQLLDGIAEADGDERAAAASLRFTALMSSKWLSFGRVLFSPAHFQMQPADDPKVLIIDGLGSDWSYYVALSYPAASIFNLGPAYGGSTWPGVNEKPPPNHRHINHTSISAAFPFPKGFFTAVVFRFPLATTDQAYQACIFECKRVLRPGGFLEVTALDQDPTNMGNRARKELRELKTRMHQQRPDVSLRNLTDMLVSLIGRRGFENVQRCMVGVPAAGHIPKSQDMSSVSSGASGRHHWQRERREDRQSQELSFADLLEDARADQSGKAKNDDNITKMVAKVGRYWYHVCYEQSLLRTNKSIWNDPALLRECEKQGTSFRLLICCAQKPDQTRRRTVSV